MDLANPAAFWLLPLAVLVLLARRHTVRRRLAVSTLYLWRELPQQHPVWRALARLRYHWLAALQIAVMVSLITALARPSLSWQSQAVAFIVDVSASMAARDDGTTRLQRAKARAGEILETLPARTQVRLLASAHAPVDLGVFAARDPALRQVIDALEVTAGASDLEAALRSVQSRDGRVPTIYVFTDTFDDGSAAHAPPDGDLHRIVVGGAAQNAAIVSLGARRYSPTHADGQVFAEVFNYGAEAHEAEIEVTQDDRAIGRERLHLEPAASATVVLDVRGLDGIIQARLHHDDALAIDDERFVVAPSKQPIRVLLAGPGSYFLEKALAAGPGVALDVSTASVETDAAGYDVVVCQGCSSVPDSTAGVLLITPGRGMSADVPLTVGDADHPVSASLDTRGASVAPIPGAPPAPWSSVILQAGDMPAVIASELQGRRTVELRVDLASSGLPLTTTFPILVANAMEWLSGRHGRVTELQAGHPLHWALRDVLPLTRIEVTGPDGDAVASHVAAGNLMVTGTSRAGIYRVRGPAWNEVFVVNPVIDGESNLLHRPGPRPSTRVSRATSVAPVLPLSGALILMALSGVMAEWAYRCRRATVQR